MLPALVPLVRALRVPVLPLAVAREQVLPVPEEQVDAVGSARVLAVLAALALVQVRAQVSAVAPQRVAVVQVAAVVVAAVLLARSVRVASLPADVSRSARRGKSLSRCRRRRLVASRYPAAMARRSFG